MCIRDSIKTCPGVLTALGGGASARLLRLARNIGIYRAGAGSAFANIGIYRAGAGSAFANIATYRAGVVSAHTGLLETSVFIARAPFRPSQMSLFIDRASFRSTSPCSEHQYLSSGCWSDLRKRRYLSIRRHFGPSKPWFLSNVRRFSPNRLARPSIAHRFVHIALVETSVLIECTPVRPSQMSVSIDQAFRLVRNVGLSRAGVVSLRIGLLDPRRKEFENCDRGVRSTLQVSIQATPVLLSAAQTFLCAWTCTGSH